MGPVGIFFTVVAIGLVIWYFKGAGKSSNTATANKGTSKQDRMLELIQSRWKRAESEKASGNLKEFASWYFEPASARQIEYLKDLADELPFAPPRRPTKGQASDLIGLCQYASQEDIDVLKFFKVSTRGITETEAREKVGQIFLKESNRTAWEKRLPTAIQKEFYRQMGLPIPKEMTLLEMEKDICQHEMNLEQKAVDEWSNFQRIYDELCDAEFRSDYELKAVTLSKFRDYWKTLRERGAKLDEIDSNDVAEGIIEEYPELER